MSRAEMERRERAHSPPQDARELIRPISGACEERRYDRNIARNRAWGKQYTWTSFGKKLEGG